MNATGLVLMIASNAAIIGLVVYCFYRVFSIREPEKTEHAPLDIDTRDRD